MKTIRIFSIVIGLCLSLSAMAQKTLTSDGAKAQKALMESLRSSGITPSIDTRDNSVCFKYKDVFYWVTFDGNSPVLYTIHRKGLNFDDDADFKSSCAMTASNEVNRKHKVKCLVNEKRIEFIIQTYAKEPNDFHGGCGKMLAAFDDVDKTFKGAYEKAFDQWKKDSIAQNKPITPGTPIGKSTLTVTKISFAN